MLANLSTVPQPLLNHLGARSRLDTLAELPQVATRLDALRQHKNSQPYHVNIDLHGLTLTRIFHCPQ